MFFLFNTLKIEKPNSHVPQNKSKFFVTLISNLRIKGKRLEFILKDVSGTIDIGKISPTPTIPLGVKTEPEE